LDKFKKLLGKYGVNSAEELDNAISGFKQNTELHKPADLKPIGLPAD